MTGPAIDTGFMLSVTIQAPPHLETGRAADSFHCGHFAVTCDAVDPGTDMHHVREIDMVRQAVDSGPGNRFPLVPVSRQQPDLRSFRRDVQVAVTALRHRRNAGYRRYISIAVTVEARDAV